MKWRSASFARQFRQWDHTLKRDQVAESRRTRWAKERMGSLPSVSAAFGPASLIYLRNPGLYLEHIERDEPLVFHFSIVPRRQTNR